MTMWWNASWSWGERSTPRMSSARIIAEIDKMNHDGSLPPGVKVVPFYDRMGLVHVTTHTVLENLVFGCVLVFFIQWIFLGDLRSAIVVGVNIPFALLFSIIMLVLQGEDANLLSIGAVDFGIIVDSAVILVENIFRNFQLSREKQRDLLEDLAEGQLGGDPSVKQDIHTISTWTDRLRLIYISAMQVDRAVLFSVAITVAAFVPLFTMQGVEGQIFGPMARTYGYALVGAVIATFTVTPVLASILLPEHVKEVETAVVRAVRAAYSPALHWALERRRDHGRDRRRVPARHGISGNPARQRIPACSRGGQLLDPPVDAADDGPVCGHGGSQEDP